MKRIGLLIPNLLHGGAEKVLTQMSFLLSEQYKVFLILFDGQSVSYEYAGELIDLECKATKGTIGKLLNINRRVKKLNKIKKELELDVVISFLRSANIVNWLSNSRSKKLISCRGYTDFIKSSNLYAKMLKRVDGIVFPSKAMVYEFIKLYDIDRKKVSLLYNPLNINRILNLKEEAVDKEILDFISAHKTICNVGSFKKDKGHWNLVKAFCLLKQNVLDAGLILVGNNGEFENEIRNMARESGYEDDIMFTGYQQNPYKIVSKCNTFVMSSLHEGFPNALIEAMACKVPIISTDCKSGPREILHLNENYVEIKDKALMAEYGVLVPTFEDNINLDCSKVSNQHRILSKAMEEILIDKELNRKYSSAAYERAEEYDISKFKESILGIINKMIDNSML